MPPRLKSTGVKLAAALLTLIIAALFIWAGAHKFYLAALGADGYNEHNLINAVQEQLRQNILRIHPTAYLIALGLWETTIGLCVVLLRERKWKVLWLCAAYIVVASALVVLANPDVLGTTNCACWGHELLDFGKVWQVLLRNLVLTGICVSLAIMWRAPKERAADDSPHGQENG